ncbi:MAG: helix-turn-helix domain-containing protein [Candidatus Paceibacterota bacterium]
MTTETLVSKLQLVGFSAKEARIYIVLLSLGSSPASACASKAGVNRSSAYVVLRSLEVKGFVKETGAQGRRHFKAVSPDVIFQRAHDVALQHQRNLEEVESILPALKGMNTEEDHSPTIEMYQGKEGVRTAIRGTRKCREKIIRLISSGERMHHILGEEFDDSVKQRAQMGIKTRSIHPDNEFFRDIANRGLLFDMDEDVFLSNNDFSFPADVAIYDDTIRYISDQSGGLVINVKSQKIADVMKELFDLAWNEAKRLQKNRTRKGRSL